MAKSETSNQLELFLKSGIYRFENTNTVFIDPVRVLNRSYTHHRVLPSAYYSRFFHSNAAAQGAEPAAKVSLSTKRKPKLRCRRIHALNDREQIADRRHREVRPLLLMAHETLLGATDLLATLKNLRSDFDELCKPITEHYFFEPARVQQSHLNQNHYDPKEKIVVLPSEERVTPLCNLAMNDTSNDVEAYVHNNKYLLPRKSCFYMSDLRNIHNLFPAESTWDFNLILIDPPWENGSARQKLKYPTLPNRYFLSLPVKQLARAEGALVALWITNREKLRDFVENELFPSWGVKHLATLYWLKLKPDGSLIGDLDLFHHRPYECLLVGYHQRGGVESNFLSRVKQIPDNQVIISVPGDYSRKPPIGELLLQYVPGSQPVRSIDLFAREMIAGWTSWGNESLHFQEFKYFSRTTM